MEEVFAELQMIKKRCEMYRMSHLENRELHERIAELKSQIKTIRKECKKDTKRVEKQHAQDMSVVEARFAVLEKRDARLRGVIVEQEAIITQHKKDERNWRQKVELLKIQLAQVTMERNGHVKVIQEASDRISELLAHQDYLNQQLEQVRALNKLFGQRLSKKKD